MTRPTTTKTRWTALAACLVLPLAACEGDGATGDDTSVATDAADTSTGDDTTEATDTSTAADTTEATDASETSEADTDAGADATDALDTDVADTAGPQDADATDVSDVVTCEDGADGCACRDPDPACDAGLACDEGVCVAAACASDAACDDDDPCTTDTCDPLTGCVNAHNTAPCDDGDACTMGDVCADGACTAGTGERACDDAIDCTVDSCDPGIGCIALADDALCDDGVACTVDSCSAASGCLFAATDSLCDDGNPCTTATCHATFGCNTTSLPAFTSCANEAECTSARHCLDLGRATSTCAALGWDDASLYGSAEVCGESSLTGEGDGCAGLLTFPEAANLCASQGARLCTAQELAADEARGSGCDYDLERVWSGTACNAGAGYLTAPGSTLGSGSMLCGEPTATAYVRCCADIVALEPTTPVCVLDAAPTGTEVCTASDPSDPCKPTGLCDVFGACQDVVAVAAECPATDPTDPCRPTGACDVSGVCVDQPAPGATCAVSDPDNTCITAATCNDLGLCLDDVLDDGELCAFDADAGTLATCFDGACEVCTGDANDPADDVVGGATLHPGDGSYLPASLCPNDDDWFAVEVPESGSLLVDVGVGRGDIERYCGADFDLQLYRPDGTSRIYTIAGTGANGCPLAAPELFRDDGGGGGFPLMFDLQDLDAGTYYVRVYGSDHTVAADDYSVRIAALEAAPRMTGFSSSSSNPFDAPGEWYYTRLSDNQEEWFRVAVTAEAPSLDVTVVFGSVDWYAEATLYQSDGSTIVMSANRTSLSRNADGRGARLVGGAVNQLAPGDYLLRVKRSGNVHGVPYTVRIRRGAWTSLSEAEPNDVLDDALVVDLDVNSVSASLTDGDVDWYTVVVPEATRLAIATGYTSCAADTAIELFDDAGVSLATNTDGGRNACSRMLVNVDPGSYHLSVTEDTGEEQGGLGGYTLLVVGR